jgi:hypothetical protein
VVRAVVRRVLVRVGVERDPPVVGTECVWVADVADEEVGAVGGREDHLLGDQSARAEVESVAVDLDPQSTHIGKLFVVSVVALMTALAGPGAASRSAAELASAAKVRR